MINGNLIDNFVSKNTRIFYIIINWFIILFLFLAVLLCLEGCKTIPKPLCTDKNGKMYGVTYGVFRGIWWRHYKRALVFASCNYWKEAEFNLLEAIKQQEGDKRRLLTYGMHPIDYFPHRELGIIKFKQEQFELSIKELTASLITEKSAKAHIYLDRARRALIEKNKLDRYPPEITIISPRSPCLTNALSVLINGVAKDDTFVSGVTVGIEKVRINVSDVEIPFSMEVPVTSGENTIQIFATDLTGKTSHTALMVNVDRTCPTIGIDMPAEGTLIPETRIVHLSGYAYDEDSGIVEVIINGQKFQYAGEKDVQIKTNVYLKPGEKDVVIDAKDRVGNIHSVKIPLSDSVETNVWSNLLAENTTSPAIIFANGKGMIDRTPPAIEMKDIDKIQITYLDHTVISGKAYDNKGITSLFINGKQILKTSTPVRTTYFSHIVRLNEGENIVNIRAIDISGYSNALDVKITRKPPKFQETGLQLQVVVDTFERESVIDGTDRKLSHGFEEMLTIAMTKLNRFVINIKKKNIQDDIDYILSGRIIEHKNSVDIYARLIDIETNNILAAANVYEENVDKSVMNKLSYWLALELADQLPVIEGRVLETDGRRIIVNIGREKHIKQGMKLIVYQLGKPILDSSGNVIDLGDIKVLGQARIESVGEKISIAYLNKKMDKKAIKAIRPMQHVITQ
ncbi:MAG: hypothetical protein GY795_43690 [Desulfobacterales bacterium]|nr:hypothetical protein [Desulfobacterales bacterium]